MQAEQEDACNPRLAYYNGALEITVTSFEHELINRSIARLFETIVEERGIDYLNSGSTTFDREDLERGFQPDSSFYIQNADRVRQNTY
jgi:Uma2 family endonuclease